MKKNLSIISFIVLLMSATLLGCSKEVPVTNKQNAIATTNIDLKGTTGSARYDPLKLGSISGVLNPVPIKAAIKAYNDHFISEEVIMNENGSFVIQNLPPDPYHLLIRYVPVNYSGYLVFEVYKIKVEAGNDTILGVISLPE